MLMVVIVYGNGRNVLASSKDDFLFMCFVPDVCLHCPSMILPFTVTEIERR